MTQLADRHQLSSFCFFMHYAYNMVNRNWLTDAPFVLQVTGFSLNSSFIKENTKYTSELGISLGIYAPLFLLCKKQHNVNIMLPIRNIVYTHFEYKVILSHWILCVYQNSVEQNDFWSIYSKLENNNNNKMKIINNKQKKATTFIKTKNALSKPEMKQKIVLFTRISRN